MAVQQQLPISAPDAAKAGGTAAAALGGVKAGATGAPPAPVWLQRVSLVVLVIFCLYLGLLLTVLPWLLKDVWDRNPFFLQHPALRMFLTRGPVRGVISGLGVLDLWIGISELIHYRDYRS